MHPNYPNIHFKQKPILSKSEPKLQCNCVVEENEIDTWIIYKAAFIEI